MRLPAAIAASLLLLCGCEERVPLNQAMAISIADHYQRYQNVNWGDPDEVLAPAAPDDSGQRWWQMRYRSPDGERRMILVDDASGWARFPAADYVARTPPRGRPDATNPLRVNDGTWVLRITPPAVADQIQQVALDREVIRLNTLAGQTGLVPLFSLRRHSDGQVGIIYGWQADRGIARDEQVLDWLKHRTRHGDSAVWEDLVSR